MTPGLYSSVHSLKEVFTHLPSKEELLLVFDIDYTLTHPTEPAFQLITFQKNIAFFQEVFEKLSPLERDIFGNLMVFYSSECALIEKEAPKWIKELQLKGYKTIALTASLTASLKKQCLVKKRIENLAKVGFDFSAFFNEVSAKSFEHFEAHYKTYPHYEKGVLFSNGENKQSGKGEVLVHFLSLIPFKPKFIYFVDDRPINLKSVHQNLKSYDPSILFQGFHFTGALDAPDLDLSKERLHQKVYEIAKEAQEIAKEVNLSES